METRSAQKFRVDKQKALALWGFGCGSGLPGEGHGVVGIAHPYGECRDTTGEELSALCWCKGPKADNHSGELQQEDNELQGVDVDITGGRGPQFASGQDSGAPGNIKPELEPGAESATTVGCGGISVGVKVGGPWNHQGQVGLPRVGAGRDIVEQRGDARAGFGGQLEAAATGPKKGCTFSCHEWRKAMGQRRGELEHDAGCPG